MKRVIALCAFISIILCLCSCKRNNEYRSDASADEIISAITNALPTEGGYERYGEEHIKYYFDGAKMSTESVIVFSALSEDIDEFGVFVTDTEESAKEAEDMCRKYLDTLLSEQRAFIESYAPEQIPKLEHAEVRTFGNYTVYAIADADTRRGAFEAVEKVLKAT